MERTRALKTGLAGIWGAVVAISVLSPDFVSGSEHQHLPIVACTTWIWGAVASGALVASMLRRDGVPREVAGLVAGVWVAAALVAILAPEMVTGSDPTRIPIAALLAPVAAAVLTTGACGMAFAFVRARP